VNGALIRRTVRETWALLAVAVAGVVVFEVLFAVAIEHSIEGMHLTVDRIPAFARRFLAVLAGTEVEPYLTPNGMMAVGFSHPIVHAILWGFAIATSTRVMAGEIDRGTADLLLSLPVRRGALYSSVSLVVAGSGAVLGLSMWAGAALAEYGFGRGPFALARLTVVSINLFAVYVAVSGGALLISAASTRRGAAVGWCVGALLASFVLNFLAAFWPPAQRVAFLGVLEYYRPLPIVVRGEWPVADVAVLAGAGLAAWAAGGIVFTRRDIRVV